MLFDEIDSFHFVGVGGVGMSAIAYILLKKGCRVSGSDLHASEVTARLANSGATIFLGHAAANLTDVKAIVVSSAIRTENPEVLEAQRRGLPIFHRSDLLAALLNGCDGIAVAGSHGKTTTTSMIAFLLERAGKDPHVLIGGDLDAIGGNAKVGSSSWMVAEADESDGSFLKFLPQIAVVTNIENDHLDHYGSEAEIYRAFVQFVSQVKPGGAAVLGIDSAAVRTLAAQAGSHCITYAVDQVADFTARQLVTQGMDTSFEVYRYGEALGTMRISVPGRHNVMNCLACVVVGMQLGVPFEQIAAIMPGFGGVKRRMELLGTIKGVEVYDDFAHHPTAIETTLNGARKRLGERKLWAIIEPRSNTMRMGSHKDGLAHSARLADQVIWYQPEGMDWDLQPVIDASANKAMIARSLDEIIQTVSGQAGEGDAVVIMSNGGFGGLHQKLLRALKA